MIEKYSTSLFCSNIVRPKIIKRFKKKKFKTGGTAREKQFFISITVLNVVDFEGRNGGRLEGPPYAFWRSLHSTRCSCRFMPYWNSGCILFIDMRPFFNRIMLIFVVSIIFIDKSQVEHIEPFWMRYIQCNAVVVN
jgi:hypothetical protein